MIKIKSSTELTKLISYVAILGIFFLTCFVFLINYNHYVFLMRWGFLGMGASIGYYHCLNKPYIRNAFFILGFFLISWCMCRVFQERPNCSVVELLYTIGYLGISLLLIVDAKSFKKVGLILTLLTEGIILAKIASGVYFTNIILENSQNYVSVLILFFLLLYYSACRSDDQDFYLFPSYVFLFCSILMRGRGGIVVSAFQCVGITLFKINRVDKKYRVFFKIIIALIIVFLVAYLFVSGIDLTDNKYYDLYFSRFNERGTVDLARIKIWKSFFNNNQSSVLSFLFGSDTTLIRRDGNLHNSFLMCYAYYGLVPAVVIVMLVFSSIVKGVRQKEYYMVFLFLTLLLRSLTDQVFFQGYCEIFLFYYIVYFHTIKIIKRKEKYERKKSMLCLHNTLPNY